MVFNSKLNDIKWLIKFIITCVYSRLQSLFTCQKMGETIETVLSAPQTVSLFNKLKCTTDGITF